jgi:hypothetical protein
MWNGSEWIWWQPHPEHPIWPPPQPPVCPPPPSGCAPPGCFDWIAKAQACWDQSQDLEAFLTQVITDIFTQNPGIIPPPPPSAGTGPIIGVSDGSDAAPGEVGEFVSFPISASYAAAPQTQFIQMGVLQPGDWDIRGNLYFETFIEGVLAYLSPQPTGVSNDMLACNQINAATGSPDTAGVALTLPTARASFAVPTLFVLKMLTNYWGAGGNAGTAVGNFEARRVR